MNIRRLASYHQSRSLGPGAVPGVDAAALDRFAPPRGAAKSTEGRELVEDVFKTSIIMV